MIKSVKSNNHSKSVIQTFDDIVKSHGGELKVLSEVGKGSEFIIIMPLEN